LSSAAFGALPNSKFDVPRLAPSTRRISRPDASAAPSGGGALGFHTPISSVPYHENHKVRTTNSRNSTATIWILHDDPGATDSGDIIRSEVLHGFFQL
jgi:hypothetical protein